MADEGIRCRSCGDVEVVPLLDLGRQPICNRYLAAPSEAEYRHPIVFGQCDACALVQLLALPPAAELRPRYDWITYREPEAHLDALVESLDTLTGPGADRSVCGISFKDDSTLARLARRGWGPAWRIDPERHLGIAGAGAGVETVQATLDAAAVATAVTEHGRAALVVCRHIIEHAHDLRGFLAAVAGLVRPDGYVVFEVPDCERAVRACDYTTIWEEHSIYFTERTLRRCLDDAGFSLIRFERVGYAVEDSLIAVARPSRPAAHADAATPADEKVWARTFADRLPARRAEVQRICEQARRTGTIAILGAGHLACVFINVLGLQELVSVVVDDDPHKQGLYMPGSRLPIRSSEALRAGDVALCLLTVNLDSEQKVIAKNAAFLEKGGRFASVFPTSPYALTA